MYLRIRATAFAVALASLLVGGCAGPRVAPETAAPAYNTEDYLIGPGDSLQIFVWQHPELSVNVPVRPDGKITIPLVQDTVAVGKTPTQLSDDLETALSEYIRNPEVSVIVSAFVGTFGNQIRVVGQAAEPQAISYRQNMTVLDVMIEVGGLGEFAAGNRAKIIRRTGDAETEIPVRLDDLLKKGKISANVTMRPGDVLIIPETIF
jgi:polysaccharide export outer membrane protein